MIFQKKKNKYLLARINILTNNQNKGEKGMPKLIQEICKTWVFDDIKPDGSIKYKGSLHIRHK